MIVLVSLALLALSGVHAQTCQDSYSNLPNAPVFPATQYNAALTPSLSSLQTNHKSEIVKSYRPAPFTPSSNPAQTGCPHLTGTLVAWHTLGFAAGTDVTLPANTRVLVHSCSFGPSDVYGVVTVPTTSELIFGDATINFKAKSIKVFGKLLAGSATCRLRNKMSITLYGSRAETPTGGDDWTKGIYVANGTIEVHGAQYFPTWTRLARSVLPADTVIFLQDTVNWEVGQSIVVTTTELKDSRDYNRNEERIIKAVYSTIYANVSAIEVTEPFVFKHYAGKPYQAEVALLSRRIVIQGDPDNSEPTDTQDAVCYDSGDSTYPCNDRYLTGFGAHVRIQGNPSIGRFSGVEWFRVGQTNVLGRYSIHFHMVGQSVATGRFYVQDSSVHRSYFRAYAIHGTNNVTLSQNVAYDVIGHAYFLEDGVEELNTIEYNFGAHIHWLGDSQKMSKDSFNSQGLYWTDESVNLILPSDTGASVYYITNSYNSIIGNVASGGWAGFAFPNLPKPVKLSQNYKNGQFTPSSRPLIAFKGNTAHSTGYWFGSAGGIYVGGTLKHKTANGPLTYTAGRDGDRSTCLYDILDTSHDQDGYCNAENKVWMRFEDTKVFLANRGAQHWGSRSEVVRVEVHDTGLSMNVFGEVYITNMLVQCRSLEHLPQNLCPSGYCNPRDQAFRSTFAGFQWYDVFQNHIVTNTEFRNCDPGWPLCENNWDGPCNGAAAFWTLTHSNQFVPEIMQSTKNIKFTNGDPFATLRFTVNNTLKQTVSGRLTNWIDNDGTVFPDAYPGQAVILGSQWANKWWRTSDACMGPRNDMWICPRGQDSVASLYIGYNDYLESLIGSDGNCPNGDGPCQIIGQVTHFGRPLADGLPLAQNPKITGPIVSSSGGWYIRFNTGTPKKVTIKSVMLHPDDSLLIAIPYPSTTTSISVKAYSPSWCGGDWARCSDTLVPASSIQEVKNSFGDKYFFNRTSQLLYYRVVQTDDYVWPSGSVDNPHEAWPKRSLSDIAHFERDGVNLMVMDAWEFRVEIVATGCTANSASLYCDQVPINVAPALGTATPTTANTFPPSVVRTVTPTTRAPTSLNCVKIWEQCSGGGLESPWTKCCFPNSECVVSNEWWGSCQACAETGDQCAGYDGNNNRWTQCCNIGNNCVISAGDSKKSFCQLAARPQSSPITSKPTTKSPTRTPTTKTPTTTPTKTPTSAPIVAQTKSPTKAPTLAPVLAQTKTPTKAPTLAPVLAQTKTPTKAPTLAPVLAQTKTPTKTPTLAPIRSPTKTPTFTPSSPTIPPSNPSRRPTRRPTPRPTRKAPRTKKPTRFPTKKPTTRFPTRAARRGD